MTSFGSLFKVMSRDRFRTVSKVILAQLAIIAVALLWSAVTRGISSGQIFGMTASLSIPVFLATFILLAITNEHVYTRDTYRLIPTGETKLYSTNLLSSLVAMIYFGVVEVVLYLITMSIDHSFIAKEAAGMPHDVALMGVKIFAASVVMAIALIILGWTTISLVHLAVTATNNFLPNVSRRAVNVVLYVIVIYLVVRVANFIIYELSNLTNLAGASWGMSQYLISLAAILFVALLEVVLNIFLLKKWVETIPN